MISTVTRLAAGVLTVSLFLHVGVASAHENAPGKDQRLVAKVWWNQQSKFEPIDLTVEQRAEMDLLLVAYLEDRRHLSEDQREAFEQLGKALQSGDQAWAQRQRDKLAAAATAPLTKQIDMMIAVTAVMTQEQREKLATTYPKLLTRLWIRSGRLGTGRSGAASQPSAASE